MSFDFSDFTDALDENELQEEPVDIDTFLNSEDYLNRPEFVLSEIQRKAILASTQIYKKETLFKFLHPEEAEIRWKSTKNEVILQMGKGSGKDLMSAISCCYLVYLLLCLKDPAKYYNKPSGDSIDIINIAVNATQASNVFFSNVSRLVKNSEWFQGKYDAKPGGDPQKSNEINFDQNINLYSGHSEREAWEGYNVILVVLDEISAFALDSTSGNAQAKTARSIYNMYRFSVDSRFPDFGKVVLLSFPRFKNDFIQQRYNAVVAEKETVEVVETLKIDEELDDGVPGNEFEIRWLEDHIVRYNYPKVFAIKRPTWKVNPNRRVQDFMQGFLTDPTETLSRFACMPPDQIDAFFKDREKVERAFNYPNGTDDFGRFKPSFLPDPSKEYYVHVDLARKIDHCAVSMAHVEKWESQRMGDKVLSPAPVIHVDDVRFWTPTPNKTVNFTEVREHIVSLSQRGFNLKLVTFDRWQSEDMIEYLNQVGIKSEVLSVAKRHYTDLALVLHEERILGPNIQLLIDELLELRLMPNDKVDHPRKGSKDLADAVCGAVFNAIYRTRQAQDEEIEILTYDKLKAINAREKQQNRNVIEPPKRRDKEEMPADLAAFLSGMKAL